MVQSVLKFSLDSNKLGVLKSQRAQLTFSWRSSVNVVCSDFDLTVSVNKCVK